jgi:hemoglobin
VTATARGEEPDAEPYEARDPAGFTAAASFYEVAGGRPTFERLVTKFYEGVAGDPVLRPMYPGESLDGAKERLLMFLEQYWGGPTTYQDARGHPRLRMRHAPFHVNPDARDRWIGHMRAAVDSLGLAPLNAGTLMEYLERAAHSMVNTNEQTAPVVTPPAPDV